VIMREVKHEDSKAKVAGGMILCHFVSVVSQKASAFVQNVRNTPYVYWTVHHLDS